MSRYRIGLGWCGENRIESHGTAESLPEAREAAKKNVIALDGRGRQGPGSDRE